MNIITTTQKLFMMRKLIMMRVLSRKNCMGYKEIMKETQITIRRKIKRMMKTQKNKMALRI